MSFQAEKDKNMRTIVDVPVVVKEFFYLFRIRSNDPTTHCLKTSAVWPPPPVA